MKVNERWVAKCPHCGIDNNLTQERREPLLRYGKMLLDCMWCDEKFWVENSNHVEVTIEKVGTYETDKRGG